MSIFRASSYRSCNSIDSTQADSRPRIHVFTLIYSVLIPLIVGSFSALLTMGDMQVYETLTRPPLPPPGWVFSVVWTVLYVLMGLASYFILVSESDARAKTMAMVIYSMQLAMNFMWSILFFTCGLYLFAFIWLMIMWAMVIVCAFRFYSINRTAAYLMIPYILWLTFAAYLNMGAYVLKLRA